MAIRNVADISDGEVLRDGDGLRVSLTMMDHADAMQSAIARAVRDYEGEYGAMSRNSEASKVTVPDPENAHRALSSVGGDPDGDGTTKTLTPKKGTPPAAFEESKPWADYVKWLCGAWEAKPGQ